MSQREHSSVDLPQKQAVVLLGSILAVAVCETSRPDRGKHEKRPPRRGGSGAVQALLGNWVCTGYVSLELPVARFFEGKHPEMRDHGENFAWLQK
ncbi:hypothetical protein DFP92_10551 [Yoonia sediminilitoris]|uniref:Uncharacterized protein n=1 Tax=Yoonia sediminilitoris TaxID=1286148 RepID=A0A2T6KH34_9RHOB|nr:hypothetical protein C8N45_10551 [Yoonia sediminilitoris]RCW95547.1 hypothetical protein DFP92_10551 [Yoonia sediminilitoris]